MIIWFIVWLIIWLIICVRMFLTAFVWFSPIRVRMILTADIDSEMPVGWRRGGRATSRTFMSLPSSLRERQEDVRRSPAAALPPSSARGEDAARLTPPEPKKRLVCSHQYRSSPDSENAFGPLEGVSPESRCWEARRMLPPTLWSALSRRLDALFASKCAGGHFAVMNILRQHSLANVKSGLYWVSSLCTLFHQITQ